MGKGDPTFRFVWKAKIEQEPGDFNWPKREVLIEQKIKGPDKYYRALLVTSSSMYDPIGMGNSVEDITISALQTIQKWYPNCKIVPYAEDT